jgi:hypothetical protein
MHRLETSIEKEVEILFNKPIVHFSFDWCAFQFMITVTEQLFTFHVNNYSDAWPCKSVHWILQIPELYLTNII